MKDMILQVLIAGWILAIVGLIVWRFTTIFRRYRGRMLVSCPETKQPAGVRVDAWRAGLSAIGGAEKLRLETCTRWPERVGCGQECLAQIEAAPADCLVRQILTNWFRGKQCALCGRAFGDIQWHDHKPALIGPERVTIDWHQVPITSLTGLLATHQPVCWDCHIAETFRREHPDRVVERRQPEAATHARAA